MFQTLTLVALVLISVLCIAWMRVLVRVRRSLSTLRRLVNTASPGEGVPLPFVTAVVAARQDGCGIVRTVKSLLAQDWVKMQVIVVDDASDDDTFSLVSEMANEDPRLLVLRNEKNPAGWVARNYALELGQGRAEGDWILFTEPYVVHGRRAVHNAVALMQRERLEHLAVHPRLEAESVVEALVLPLFFLLCEFRFIDRRAAQPDSQVGAGIAAFNLVSAEAYRLRGTHARIRGSMLDDRALGKMMRLDGGRGSIVRAVSQVRYRPYRTLSELYAGVRRGALASYGNSALRALLGGTVHLLTAMAPPILLALGLSLYFRGESVGTLLWIALPTGLAMVLPALGLLRARTMVRFEPLAVLLAPLGELVIGVSILHAAFVFAVRGTVEWRGRMYSRRDLNDYV